MLLTVVNCHYYIQKMWNCQVGITFRETIFIGLKRGHMYFESFNPSESSVSEGLEQYVTVGWNGLGLNSST